MQSATAEWPHETALRETAGLAWKSQWAPRPELIASVVSLTGQTEALAQTVLRAVVSFTDGLEGAVAFAGSCDCPFEVRTAIVRYERAYRDAAAQADLRVAA